MVHSLHCRYCIRRLKLKISLHEKEQDRGCKRDLELNIRLAAENKSAVEKANFQP